MRMQPDLLERIDAIRSDAGFHTRTDLIEKALAAYLVYLEEIICEEDFTSSAHSF